MHEDLKPGDALFHHLAASVGQSPDSYVGQATCDISIVLPFRNEQENLPELLQRLQETLEDTGLDYELVLVDDGSTDGGSADLAERAKSDPRIKVLVLSRNFGQHVAASAGIDHARGRMVMWMDSDLQERPEDIPRFIDKLREGYDVVYARRKSREQSWTRTLLTHVYLAVMTRLAGMKGLTNRPCMCLFTSQVADSIRSFPERNRFLGYMMAWMGYHCTEIDIEIDPRRRGETNYSYVKLIKLGLIGLTSFSVVPLRFSAVLSGLTMLACFAGVVHVLYKYFMYGNSVTGWASLIITILFLQALQFALLAIMGEYIGQTYTETKRRPLYFCARAINLPVSVAGQQSATTPTKLQDPATVQQLDLQPR